jgi:predicted NBD/HSP70 family sugar kinase
MNNYVAYDIGGSAIKWSLINEAGEILKSGKVGVPKDIDECMNFLGENANKYKVKYDLKGIAISAPGAVDSETGVIGGHSAVRYIHGPNFKEILLDKTGLNVEIENDANCAALGECWIGAAKKEKDSAFVVSGSGIGGAIVKDKKIHKGINKHGGEFGYCLMAIDPNEEEKFLTWSDLGSTAALSRKVAKRKGVLESEMNGLKAFELYDRGDEIALEEVNKYFTYMAMGIYNIQYTYDPEVIVIGGAISEREGFLELINEKLDEIMNLKWKGKIRPVVRKCKYGNDANKLGALYNYLQRTGRI